MADQNELERLYREAQAALKAKEYDRAAGLLTQILVIDEDYKDVSRLLAQSVKLKRRRWYNDPRLWGTLGALLLVGLGLFIVPKISSIYAAQPPTQAVNSTITPPIATPTQTLLPTPTPIPLTWKRISMGQEFKRDQVTALVIDTEDSDLLYADMQHAGIYKSINGGISWGPVQPNELSNNPSYLILLQASRDANQHVSTFSNTAPDGIERLYQYGTLEENTSSRWYVSEDGGATWTRFSEGGTYNDFNPIAFDKPGAVYVFCGRNICKFSPNGKSINIFGEPGIGGQSVIAVSPKDPNTIYAAGDGIAVSKDGGLTWARLDNGIGSDVLQLKVGIGSSPFLYLLLGECFDQTDNRGRAQPLYLSPDGGATWEFLNDAGCYLIKDANGNTLYRNAKSGWPPHWIWRSSNNGKSWVKVYIPIMVHTSEETLVADPDQSGVLFTYYSDPFAQFITKNYGDSWEKSPITITRHCYGSTLHFIDKYRPMAIDPRDGNHVFVIDNGTLLESHDSCDTTATFAKAPNTSMNSIAFDPNTPDILYAGTDGGAYISYDSGATWGQVNDGLLGAVVVYSIAVDKDDNVYAATPYGVFKLEKK